MPIRTLFVNAGILGHQSVARLVREAVQHDNALESHHLDLSAQLSTRDRLIRRALCMRPFGAMRFRGTNLDLARWRHEYHAGLLAARRIRALEKLGLHFDVLHFHTQPCAYASLKRMGRTPSIVSIDATQGLASLEATSLLERWTYRPNMVHDGLVFRQARAIIATSKWAADDLARSYPTCADKLNVMPYPIKLNRFDPSWISERYQRAEASPNMPMTFLFIGGDFVRKGGPELLSAWRQGRFSTSARLVLVSGYDFSKIDLPPGVTVRTGISAYTNAWYDLWREADVFIMPTHGEAFGMVFQEASAAGLPSIGTRLNAIPEIVDHGISGLLIEPGHVYQLVVAMRTLADSIALRRRMGRAARAKMERQARPEDYSHKLCQMIRKVASGRDCPGGGRLLAPKWGNST